MLAASQPSTTLWSQLIDRFMSLATSSWPFRIVGRSTIRLGPIIATSGRLITGVVQIPPSGPRKVIVIVDQLSPAEVTLPEIGRAAGRARGGRYGLDLVGR